MDAKSQKLLGLLTTIIPYKAENSWGKRGIGGVPLDSHDLGWSVDPKFSIFQGPRRKKNMF